MTARLKEVPGESGLPVIGHTLRFMKNCNQLFDDMSNKYGPIYYNRFLNSKVVHLLSPQGNEFVLLDRQKNFSSKRAWNMNLKKLFPNGLMLRDGDDHRYHRRLLGAPFKSTALEVYVQQMNADISTTVGTWAESSNFLFHPAIKQLTLDLATKVFIGEELNEEADQLNQAFIDVVAASMVVVRYPMFGNKYQRGLEGRALLENYFSSRLNMAAHDTTTSSLSSVCYALAKNPQWQDSIREQIVSHGESQLLYEDMLAFDTAGLVLKEALRLYPPLPIIPRYAIRDCEFEGYKINRGDMVNVSPSFTHRDPNIWSKPEKFDPPRFNSERAEDKQHKHAWIPFGGGAHKCLGIKFAELQVKLVLFHLLKSYELRVADGYVMPYQPAPIGKPSDQLPLTLVPRD